MISPLSSPGQASMGVERAALPVGPDYTVTLNLYQLAGVRVLIEKEISHVERHVRVIGGNHQEYLDQLRGARIALQLAKTGG